MRQAAGKLDTRNLKVSLRKSEVAGEGERITEKHGAICLGEREGQ